MNAREKGKKKRHHFQELRTTAYGTLNATPRIPQQFAKITAVICRRLCSYCVPVLVYPYTYFHTHVYTQHSIYIRAHEGRCCTQYTQYPGVGIIASEHARSNFRSAFLALSTRSLPLYTPPHSLPSSTPEPLPPMSILSPRPKPLNASAGAHVHPNRLYLHLIASSKVLLPHV